MHVDLTDKTLIVTGASSGIGKVAARAFARMGGTVILACRDEGRGQATLDQIRSSGAAGPLVLELVDLSRPANVRRFAEKIVADHPRIDVLLNNAGAWPSSRTVTEDGLELTFATNVLGSFLTAELLRETLVASAPSRVVNVASTFAGGLDIDDLQFERRTFEGRHAYRQSKQANRMLTWALAERLEGTGVTANAVHPGLVDTGLSRDFTGLKGMLAPLFTRAFGRSPEQGADTLIWASVAPELKAVTGRFFADRREKTCEFRSAAQQNALWERCEAISSGG